MAEMTTQDIVKTEVKRTMPDADWRTVYAHIHEMVKQPKHRIPKRTIGRLDMPHSLQLPYFCLAAPGRLPYSKYFSLRTRRY